MNPTNQEQMQRVEGVAGTPLFDEKQMEYMIEQNLAKKDLETLTGLLNHIPRNSRMARSDTYYKGLAYIAYHNADYSKLYEIIQLHHFKPTHHDFMQRLYYNARYNEAKKKKKLGRELHPVDKLRIRKRYSLPHTIWDGDVTRYNLKVKSVKMLIASFMGDKYPSAAMKQKLSKDTGMSVQQITTWFGNRRKRGLTAKEKKEARKMAAGNSARKPKPTQPTAAAVAATPRHLANQVAAQPMRDCSNVEQVGSFPFIPIDYNFLMPPRPVIDHFMHHLLIPYFPFLNPFVIPFPRN